MNWKSNSRIAVLAELRDNDNNHYLCLGSSVPATLLPSLSGIWWTPIGISIVNLKSVSEGSAIQRTGIPAPLNWRIGRCNLGQVAGLNSPIDTD